LNSDNGPFSVKDRGNATQCGCADIVAGQGEVRLADDLPLHTTDTAHGRVSERVEAGGREVEVAKGASLTPVRQGDLDDLALVWS
jgi:hypothetical protein